MVLPVDGRAAILIMLGVDSNSPGSGPPRPADWRARGAAFLLGTVVVGITVNVLSERPVPALGMVGGSAAVLGISWWLRRYPAGSILCRATRMVLWCGATGFGLMAAQGWASSRPEHSGTLRAVGVVASEQLRMIAPYAAVVGLLAVTVLTSADLFHAARRLGTAVVVALGTAYVCAAQAELTSGGNAPDFFYYLLLAAGVFLGCWAWLHGDSRARAKVLVGVGVAVLLLGVIDREQLDAFATQCGGTALVTAGMALHHGRDRLWRGAVGAFGVLLGVGQCWGDDPVLGVSAVVFGMALVLLSADSRNSDLLTGVAYLGLGAPFVMYGVGMVRFMHPPYLDEVPAMIETVLAGVALILHGTARLRGAEARRWMGRWWEIAIADRTWR